MSNEYQENQEEFVEVFVKEMSEYADTLENNALELEKNPNKEKQITEIKRVLHSVKGIFGLIGEHYSDLRVLTHELENFWEEKEEISPEKLDLILKFSDGLRELIKRIEKSNQLEATYQDLFVEIKEKVQPEILTEETFEVKVFFSKNSIMKSARMLSLINKLKRIAQIDNTKPSSDELMEEADFDYGTILLRTREGRHKIADIISRIPEIENFTIIEIKPEKFVLPEDKEKPIPWEMNKIEVSIEKLDKIISLLEELIVVGNIIENLNYAGLSSGEIEILSSFLQNVVTIQELVFEIKQVPIEVILKKIPRLVRDLSKKLGKKAQVYLINSHIGMDRVLVESLADPIVVIVQNALIHGIETPEERKSVGKSENGKITITAEVKEGKSIITIEDDGRGIDLEKLWEIAKRKKIIPEKNKFSPEKSIELIFYPEISTSGVSTIEAGRGMGLYGVKNIITSLGGKINVKTEKNKGTTFILSFPLKKPIIPIIIARVGEIEIGIPQEEIEYIQRIREPFEIDYSNIIFQPSFKLEKDKEIFLIINLIQQISTENLLNSSDENSYSDHNRKKIFTSEKESLAILYTRKNNKKIGFLVNDVIEIKELAINYEDPITEIIPYVQGSARIKPTKGILILNLAKFIGEDL